MPRNFFYVLWITIDYSPIGLIYQRSHVLLSDLLCITIHNLLCPNHVPFNQKRILLLKPVLFFSELILWKHPLFIDHPMTGDPPRFFDLWKQKKLQDFFLQKIVYFSTIHLSPTESGHKKIFTGSSSSCVCVCVSVCVCMCVCVCVCVSRSLEIVLWFFCFNEFFQKV